jgi:hypothetical protein
MRPRPLTRSRLKKAAQCARYVSDLHTHIHKEFPIPFILAIVDGVARNYILGRSAITYSRLLRPRYLGTWEIDAGSATIMLHYYFIQPHYFSALI